MYEIRLNAYRASAGGFQALQLGTKDSYGVERLKIIPGPDWAGSVITATFSHNGKALADPVVVPDNGVIEVPAGATAQELKRDSPGLITFRGVADGVQRISTDFPYTVATHGPVEGTAPAPTPSEWEQLVTEYQNRLDKAVPPDGTPGYVLGKTEDGNAWVPQTGGGGGGSGGVITDDDNGAVYDAELHIQDGHPVLILKERS